MVGELSPALSSRALLDPGPPHTTLTTRRPEGRHPELERHGAAAITKPQTTTRPKAPRHATKRQPPQKTTHDKRPRPGVSCALLFPRFQRFATPRFRLRLPSSSCEKLLEKGRSLVPSASFHEPTNGERSASPFPHTKRRENRREN